MDNKIVQSFWYSKDGDKNYISTIEIACVASYLTHSHRFHLYTYTPHDTSMTYLRKAIDQCLNAHFFEIIDARSILSEDELFFDNAGSVGIAAFSDYFRFQLLYQKGGWWVDMDTICLRPLDFENPYVFATERKGEGIEDGAATCMIKAPKESKFLAILLKRHRLFFKKNLEQFLSLNNFRQIP